MGPPRKSTRGKALRKHFVLVTVVILILSGVLVNQPLLPKHVDWIYSEGSEPSHIHNNDSFTNYCQIGVSRSDYVCLYHNVIYSIPDTKWMAFKDQERSIAADRGPLLNNLGLNNRHSLPSNDSNYKYSSCSERFIPAAFEETNFSRDNALIANGTTYFVCVWLDHFGHILINMLVPAFNALSKLGLAGELGTVNFLLDQRCTIPGWSGNINKAVFDFATGFRGGTIILEDLIEEAHKKGISRIFFQRLAVGMFQDSVINAGIGDKEQYAGVEIGTLQPLRDQLNKMYPRTKEELDDALSETLDSNFSHSVLMNNSHHYCTVTLLDRKGRDRYISNKDEVLGVIKDVFDPSIWSIRSVFFDRASLKSQYLTLQSTALLLSVTGSGTHMAMFLPDGAASVELSFLGKVSVNKLLCAVIPSLACYIVGANTGPSFEKAKSGPVVVDLVSLNETLARVHDQLNGRCILGMTQETRVHYPSEKDP